MRGIKRCNTMVEPISLLHGSELALIQVVTTKSFSFLYRFWLLLNPILLGNQKRTKGSCVIDKVEAREKVKSICERLRATTVKFLWKVHLCRNLSRVFAMWKLYRCFRVELPRGSRNIRAVTHTLFPFARVKLHFKNHVVLSDRKSKIPAVLLLGTVTATQNRFSRDDARRVVQPHLCKP